MRGDNRIQHLRDGLLLGLGQRFDELKLLRHLGLWPAFAGAALGGDTEHVLHAGARGIGQRRQRRNRHAPRAALVGGDGLLRDAEHVGQLHLGQALSFAQVGQAFAEGDEEGAFFLTDGHGGGGEATARS